MAKTLRPQSTASILQSSTLKDVNSDRKTIIRICQFFKHSSEKPQTTDVIPVRGLLFSLHPLQVLAVYKMFEI